MKSRYVIILIFLIHFVLRWLFPGETLSGSRNEAEVALTNYCIDANCNRDTFIGPQLNLNYDEGIAFDYRTKYYDTDSVVVTVVDPASSFKSAYVTGSGDWTRIPRGAARQLPLEMGESLLSMRDSLKHQESVVNWGGFAEPSRVATGR